MQLFQVTALKLRLDRIGASRFDLGENGGRVEFSKDARVDPAAVVRLVQRQPDIYRLAGPTRLRIKCALPDLEERFAFADQLIHALRPTAQPSGIAAG